MSIQSTDKFETGLFWELYKDLERQFQNFLVYVPYLKGNERTYSFVLYTLILSIGGYIDSAFKEMARYEGFTDDLDFQRIVSQLQESIKRIKMGKSPKIIPIKHFLEIFEKKYNLSKRKVIFKLSPIMNEITPFTPHSPKTNAPKWWDIYNGLKHNAGINIREANLHMTRDALAGAFILNAIHIPSILRFYEYGILKRTDGGIYKFSPRGIETLKRMLKDRKQIGFVETPLFKYNY